MTQNLVGGWEMNIVIPDIFYTQIGNLAVQRPLNELKLLAGIITIKVS